jgi:hypothetical protein
MVVQGNRFGIDDRISVLPLRKARSNKFLFFMD